MKIFSGKEFVEERIPVLRDRVERLKEKGITPKLVSIVVGDEKGALKYQEMKKNMAESVGAVLDIKHFDESASMGDLLSLATWTSLDASIHGVMLQLPLPDKFSKEDQERIIGTIDPEKDVDGMREDSKFVTPVVGAILDILDEAGISGKRIAVVGSSGFVGGRLVEKLAAKQHTVIGLDFGDNLKKALRGADVVVSATGSPGIITADLVKDGVILIDVGFPKGDIEKEAYDKASFVSPVPGGVGPVTIYKLVENLVISAEL